MPPKRQRSGTTAGVSPTVVGAKTWESGLVAATLEEEFWKLNISWVVTDCLEDEWYLSALTLAVQQPLRRHFSIISWETTLHKINELGNPKVKKVKELPPFHEVMEVAKSTLDAGEEISTELMAKLLKFQLLCMKTADLQRATELKATEEKSKAKSASSSSTKDSGKPANKAEKGKKNAEVVASVKDTKLRRRGEEDDSHKFIDDGPQHYVLLLGFCQPMLLSALDSIGVHILNIIRLCSKNREDCDVEALSCSGTANVQNSPQVWWMPKELNNFWIHLEEIFLSSCNQSKLSDVARLNCVLEKSLCPNQDNVEAVLDCGAQVFEGISSLIYDCLDWRQEHLYYLSSMKLIDVPSITSGQTRNSPESSTEVQTSAVPTSVSKKKQPDDSPDLQEEVPNTYVDMRLYSDLLKQIPPECISASVILHCMLDQVVMSEQGAPPEHTTSKEPLQSESKFTYHVISAASNLPRSPEEKKRLMENFGKLKDMNIRSCHTRPLLINYHDKRAERMHQCPTLGNFHVTKIEGDMVKNDPVWNLLHSELNQDRDIGFLHRTRNAFLTQDQKFAHLLSDGLMNTDVSDWNVLEHFKAPVFSQVLTEASQTYPSMDTYRSTKDGSLFIVCHNPISSQRDSRQSWDVSLHTDVGFRNYLEHVASSLSGWNMQIGRSSEATVFPQSCADSSQGSSKEKSEVYIQEQSLKALKLEQDRLKKEEQEKMVKKDKTVKTTGKGNRPDSAKDNKKILSNKSQEELQESSQAATFHAGDVSNYQNTSGTQTAFTGYSMNGSLIHLTSEMHSLYLADGGVIQEETYNFIHGFPQKKINIMKDNHHFFMYYSGINRVMQNGFFLRKGKLTDLQGSFFAVLSTGMKLSFSHPRTGRQELERTPSEIPSVATSNNFSQTQSLTADEAIMPPDSTLLQGLHVCTPDGVIIHFICQETGDGRSKKVFVRQSSAHLHPSCVSDDCDNTELSRMITGEGTVIRHFRDGSSEILFGDGTVSRHQVSEDISHSGHNTFRKDKEYLRKQSMNGRDSKERKGKITLEVGTGNEVDELKKQNNQGPEQLSWTTTTPSGLRLHTSGDSSEDIHRILTYTSTDPFSQTVVTVREDGVITVQEANGTKVTEHADGTRITTFYQEAKEVIDDMPCKVRRQVMIKQIGFPTVLMDDDGGCHVVFGDGTDIIANASGSYQIMPFNSGVISINEEGQAIYTSQQRSPTTQKQETSSYMMSTSAGVLCEITDAAGNQFKVKADGQGSVADITVTKNNIKDCLETHTPRIFVAHGDGSGFELLSSRALEVLLLEAHTNPAIAILKEAVPEYPEAQEITLLKPSHLNQGLTQKQKKDIISTHLRCRNWDHFPSDEEKTIGPSFGTNLSSNQYRWDVSSATHPVLSCPEVLLVRQLIYIPTDKNIQEHTQLVPQSLEDRHPQYVMQVSSREKVCQDMQLLEFRSSDEQEAASNLLQQLLRDNIAVLPSTEAH